MDAGTKTNALISGISRANVTGLSTPGSNDVVLGHDLEEVSK